MCPCVPWQVAENSTGWKRGSVGHWYGNASRYRKLLYMLDQVRATACSKGQHFVGGKGGELAYIRMNVDYGQMVSKDGLQKAASVLA